MTCLEIYLALLLEKTITSDVISNAVRNLLYGLDRTLLTALGRNNAKDVDYGTDLALNMAGMPNHQKPLGENKQMEGLKWPR
jgi:hypothetical protein